MILLSALLKLTFAYFFSFYAIKAWNSYDLLQISITYMGSLFLLSAIFEGSIVIPFFSLILAFFCGFLVLPGWLLFVTEKDVTSYFRKLLKIGIMFNGMIVLSLLFIGFILAVFTTFIVIFMWLWGPVVVVSYSRTSRNYYYLSHLVKWFYYLK